jgi:hypothetical protein
MDNSQVTSELPEALRAIFVDKRLDELSQKYPGLVIYPARQQENLANQCLLKTVSDQVWTTNLMGVVAVETGDSVEPTLLSVGSRFDAQPDGKANPAQPFLTYLLSQAFDGALVNWPVTIASTQDFWELLLVFLYAHHLVKACRQGMLKQYVSKRVNDYVLAGTLDVPQHLRQNVPFVGKVSQARRLYSRDNPTLWLIRAANEHICRSRGATFYSALLRQRNTLKECVEAVAYSTPSFDYRCVYDRVAECLRPVRHPYFREFEPLRRTSLQILRRSGINLYRRGKPEVYGVLFDGAWLWEEFLSNALRAEGFQHPCEARIFRYSPRPMLKPDLVHKSQLCVLDAKYKHWKDREIEDFHQVLAYMYLLGARVGGVIHPVEVNNRRWALAGSDLEPREIALRDGKGFWLDVPFPVPQGCTNAREFPEITELWRVRLSATLHPLLSHN